MSEHTPIVWKSISDSTNYLEYAQLMSETFGYEIKFKPLYYREDDPNQFIFSTDSPDSPYIFVHLTWKVEHDINFPYIKKIDIDSLTIT